jgi:hypothetical protein
MGTKEVLTEAKSHARKDEEEESEGSATRMRLHHGARLDRRSLRGATTTLAGQTHGLMVAKLATGVNCHLAQAWASLSNEERVRLWADHATDSES